MNDPRYPIGKPELKQQYTPDERTQFIDQIAAAPSRLRAAAAGLNDSQLDTPYRDGGWSVRQVVHHVPDSHLNAYIRTKLALTESEPTIKPYDEAAWAALDDSRSTPIDVSLTILEKLHERWVNLLRSMGDRDFAKTFVHPDHGKRTVDWLVALYAWHGRHHTGHITSLRERKGW
jgi:uncharacterized damage-inducible protein DinB